MGADHERSSVPWEIEWIVLPEAFCLMAGALKQTRFILEGLEVDAAKMRANIDLTNGLVMSEAVMMGLGRYIGRDQLKPGDLVLYGPAPHHHVELYVGPGNRTVGHGSPPVDYGDIYMIADPHFVTSNP